MAPQKWERASHPKRSLLSSKPKQRAQVNIRYLSRRHPSILLYPISFSLQPPQKEKRASHPNRSLHSDKPKWRALVILRCHLRRQSSFLLNPILNTSSSEVVKGLSVAEILRITSNEKRSRSSMIMMKQGEKAIYKNLLNKIYIDTLWRDKSVHFRKLKKN